VTPPLYVPGRTVVHRAPAGLKLVLLAALAVVVFAVPTPVVVLGGLATVLLVALGIARLPLSLLIRQVRVVAVFLVLVLVIQLAVAGPVPAVVSVARLLGLVLAATLVTATTPVSAMVALVERVCAPLRRVGVRPARIGLVIAMTLRFLPLVAERADRLREAQVARGGAVGNFRALTRTAVPLVVQLLQLAHTVSEALDARGADDVPMRRGGARAA
jgi:biotin transport system permease protein